MLRTSLGDWQRTKMITIEKRRAAMVLSRLWLVHRVLWRVVWLGKNGFSIECWSRIIWLDICHYFVSKSFTLRRKLLKIFFTSCFVICLYQNFQTTHKSSPFWFIILYLSKSLLFAWKFKEYFKDHVLLFVFVKTFQPPAKEQFTVF